MPIKYLRDENVAPIYQQQELLTIIKSRRKSMSIVIPDDILQASQTTEEELKLELALLLYKQNKISSGKVRAWLGLTVLEFQHELAQRNLDINYDIDDLNQDLETLKSLELL
jgi:predicted HTH domain antitoxin